jgi:hypothetical protein
LATNTSLPPGSIPPPTDYPQQGPGWWSRNWKWFVPTLIIVVFVLPLAMCGGIVFMVMSSMKDSDVVRESLARAQANPVLIGKLGTPIKMGMLVGGSINVTSTDGRADLEIPISGPKGKAKVNVLAVKTAGEWHYKVMRATIEGGDRINLLTEAEQKQSRELDLPSDSSPPEPSSN